jgi:hypothetical protein
MDRSLRRLFAAVFDIGAGHGERRAGIRTYVRYSHGLAADSVTAVRR